MSNNGPCLGCRDKMMGCHVICQAYKKYRKERDEMLKKKNAENDLYNSTDRLSWRDKKRMGLVKGGRR